MLVSQTCASSSDHRQQIVTGTAGLMVAQSRRLDSAYERVVGPRPFPITFVVVWREVDLRRRRELLGTSDGGNVVPFPVPPSPK